MFYYFNIQAIFESTEAAVSQSSAPCQASGTTVYLSRDDNVKLRPLAS